MNVTYYLWDGGTVECEPDGPLPARCTPIPPPGPNMVWGAGGWVAKPTPDLDALKAALHAQVSDLRWQHETGGIMLGGSRVLTGIADQNRIASVLVAQPATVDFKGADGWVTLTLAELQGIATAIAAHVQACFTAEWNHHEAIDALPDVASALAYDPQANWPVSA